MVKQQLLEDLKWAVEDLGFSGDDIVISSPQNPSFGDYTANIALQLAKQKLKNCKQTPMEIANEIVSDLRTLSYLSDIEIKEPGFINFFIKPEFLTKDLEEILEKGKDFGRSESGKGKKASVEFVSANPTGPMHFGNARGGPIGDTLASVLEFCGYEVMRDYYHNDIGSQVDKLGESIVNVAQGQKLEDQEYKGEYVKELAKEIKTDDPKQASKQALEILLKENLDVAKEMGIKFDRVSYESEFLGSSQTKKALMVLEEKDVLKKQEGAVWFAPGDEFLKDRESVVIKSDGNYTYFTNDIAYHNLKFSQGTDLVVDILGANHHGHVPRLKAAVSVLGFDVSNFHVVLYQWVRFKRGGEIVKMSKRAGTFITVREILEEIGKDPLKFFILMYDANSPIDFDLELAKQQSNKNPVFYVQYAFARMANILRKVKSEKCNPSTVLGARVQSCGILNKKEELELIKHLSYFPDLIEEVARNYQVQHLTTYAITLADLFHKFYENCRVLNAENEELKTARLSLVLASKLVLANVLGIMGIDAPERM
ncbi:arginine--tRNA ligase [Candidatus Daviesbacteria bacterium RIFOXYD1_FULL_41_10]|uniref:Arginine--tRNA ligase n=3 Tax=Microgenomates group TaxID=1794810 RepID=A0A1F5N263_9BACT|nr:MAG: Arginine-tRNA ligase [Candidatus Curtissbacteria bacterium GW2011_GWA1_41_11]KKS12643.1 MAG: Arginine-tRNA ligase [Candidatus Daviesbacteria bacterium GW2011_GWB1_41_5]OGE71727.1 MAG: arginine--tRNA ligase [Candidatus Daviesbacteria bacterium RIFOXYD1_FULL_41_10]